MNYQVTAEDALIQLLEQNEFSRPGDPVGRAFTVMMKHGSMTIEYFAPHKIDSQTPHKQDEIYIVIKGHGTFYRNGERVSCKKTDILFVPAGMDHHFEDFSDDFAAWVIFYGPEGGENS